MNDEHERQQRDLQRATTLLETMSREDMVELLLEILSNERSDDTRKLSDWMAFQIILHDATRQARKLLAQLGKVSPIHPRVVKDCFRCIGALSKPGSHAQRNKTRQT